MVHPYVRLELDKGSYAGGVTLKQFIHDMINLTEGQKLVKYWWLWLSIVILTFAYLFIKSRFEK